MKKSARVTLTVVTAAALAACARRRLDPCDAASFNQQACQEAIDRGGYYWQGSWCPVVYHYPYPYYFDSYRTYVAGGGRVVSAPGGTYVSGSGTPGSSSPSSSTSVTRGGFGSTGAGHGGG